MTPSSEHLEVHYGDGTMTTFVPEEPGSIQLYQQLHDYQLWPATFEERPAEVFRLDPFDHTVMDCRIQEMYFGQIRLEGSGLAADLILRAWTWLTRSNAYLTNGQGPDIRHDCILNQRTDQPLPGIFPLGLGGNVYRGVEESYRGVKSLRVSTMTPLTIYPSDLSHDRYPWWIHYGTVTTRKRLADGTYVVNPFSNNYWIGRNAPSPLMASEPVWIDMAMVRKLPLGAPAPCPYNPPRW